MTEFGGSIASERSLSLSEGIAEGSECARGGVAKLPFVNGRFDGVEEVGRYITLLAARRRY